MYQKVELFEDPLEAYELTAVPLITARIGCAPAIASGTLFRYRAPNPSALAYPSEAASKVWQVAVGERAPSFAKSKCVSGPNIRLLPATIAASHSPFCRELTAQ